MLYKKTLLDGVIIMTKRKEIVFEIPTGYDSKEYQDWLERNKEAIKKIKVQEINFSCKFG